MSGNRARRCIAAAFLALALGAAALPTARAAGSAEKNTVSPKDLRAALVDVKRTLDERFLTADMLSDAMGQVTALRGKAGDCQQASQDAIDRAAQALAALGDKQANEAADLARTRQRIEAHKTQDEDRRAECRLAVVFADSLIAEIDNAQKNLLKERLTRREDGIWRLALLNIENPQAWVSAGIGAATDVVSWGLDRVVATALVVLLAALAIAFGGWLGRAVTRRLGRPPAEAFSAQVAHGVIGAFAAHAGAWTAAATLSAASLVADTAYGVLSFRSIVAVAAVALMSASIAIRGVFVPRPPAASATGLDASLARPLARRLTLAAGMLVLGVVLFLAPDRVALPYYAYDFGRAVFVTLFVLTLGWLTWLVGHVPRLRRTGRSLRILLMTSLAVIVAAEWLGFRNLSSYLLSGLMATAGIGGAAWLVAGLVTEICAGLDGEGGAGAWPRYVREHLGLGEEDGFPGLVWLRLVLLAAAWCGAGLLLLRAWGLSDTGTAIFVGYLVDGVAIGDMHFIPSKVVTGTLLFVALAAFARWLRNWIDTKWLSRSRMERGARDALVTLIGYVGFTIAFLMGLSSAGVSFASLAIIASALSVGIGFGLQNIVSNFVAGLILLFERPIKTGDWVVVGGTEGYVRRIRVRATEIRTFERSDVTVPNSELITGHVKNWTLRDRLGRAVVPIGVAYGSDTDLVRRLLVEVARAHPAIVQDPKHEPVKVLFRSFGDSALNFELRFVVRNVEERLDVVSDINFAIDRLFRAHGIEIPFPQHELRIRDWDEGAAIRLARGAPKAAEDEEEPPLSSRGAA